MIALDNGFNEATAIVDDLDASIARLGSVFGYRLIWQGAADPAALALMGVDPAWPGREALVGDAAQGRGFIRLFAFPGHPTDVMRDGAQAWDCGGIFDINIRALGDIEPLHAAMTRSGFCAFGPLTAWQFGPLSVKQAVSRDSDGLAIAIMQRVDPPLLGFEPVGGSVSYVFNSTQVVPDFAAARAFYVDRLGWEPVQEARWVHEDGRNCMGLPPDLARTKAIRVGIYQARGLNEGSVEILEYAGESCDYSNAAPPGRGWAALRFPVSDLPGVLARAQGEGTVILPPRAMAIEPFGIMQAAALVTPWGARLELFGFR